MDQIGTGTYVGCGRNIKDMPTHAYDIAISKPAPYAFQFIPKRQTLLKSPVLLVIHGHLIIDVPYQRYPHLGGVIPPQHVADEVCLDLHLHHFKSTPQDPTEDIRVPQLILCPAIVRELDKVCQGVLVKDERELLVIARPVRDRRCDVEEDLESNLRKLVRLNVSFGFGITSLRNHLRCLSKV